MVLGGTAATGSMLAAASLGGLHSLPRVLVAAVFAAVLWAFIANAWTLAATTLLVREPQFLRTTAGFRHMSLCGGVAVATLVAFGFAMAYAAIDAALAPPALPTAERSGSLDENTWRWRIWTPEGSSARLADLRGRPIFLNVFATWCPPCVGELPSIQSLFDSTRGTDAAFLVVSEESADTVRSFVAARKFTFPVYVADHLPAAFRTHSIPATFILDRQGQVVLRRLGAADWDDDAVRTLLR